MSTVGATVTNLLKPDFARIPEELKVRPQWVVWRCELNKDGKLTKVPYTTATRKASHSDPATWLSFDAAWALYERDGFDGVGYVFSPEDPYCGIDLDGKGPDGLPKEKQLAIAQRFSSYTERSPSDTGVHIIVKAKLPGGGRKKGPIEIYDRTRYFTVTGHVVEGGKLW